LPTGAAAVAETPRPYQAPPPAAAAAQPKGLPAPARARRAHSPTAWPT
jgi:hypothetical protein